MKLTHRLLTALLLVPLAALHATDLALSTNGSTGFRIVKPANPSVVDDYALAKLSGYLKQITGVEFPFKHRSARFIACAAHCCSQAFRKFSFFIHEQKVKFMSDERQITDMTRTEYLKEIFELDTSMEIKERKEKKEA